MIKNITLSAEETLIREARAKARRENTSLNSVFRHWLVRYTGRGDDFRGLMDRLDYADAGGRFDRDELNLRR